MLPIAPVARFGPRGQRVQGRHVVVEPDGLTEREIEVVHIALPSGTNDVVVDVGDVAHIAHPVTSIDQPALQHVVGDVGRSVPEVGGVVGRDAAHVHRHGLAWSERSDLAPAGVVEVHGGGCASPRP